MINHRPILRIFPGAKEFNFHHIISLLTIMWCLLPLSLIAREHSLTFRTINISNGLSHNMVNAIYKDHRGFVWLGTQLGLDRFDGISETILS
jgi:ligand-binding sensor domain-containing protein